MHHLRMIPLGVAMFAAVGLAAPAVASGPVTVNGVPLPRALGSIEATIDVTEYRDGNDPTIIRLVAASKRYSVCVLTPDPVGVFDAELPVADTPDRFAVTVEDGREFSACLLESLNTVERPLAIGPPPQNPGMVERPRDRRRDSGPRQVYKYCLRCENVTVPAP